MTTREQAAREPSLDYKSKMDNSEPFVLKRRTEGERLAYLQGYNAGAEHEAKRDKWVSVKEQEPPKGIDLLLWLIPLNKLAATIVVGSYSIHERNNFWVNGRYWDASHVTHWQPLPEPPKEESE